jgi:hypothetical protein
VSSDRDSRPVRRGLLRGGLLLLAATPLFGGIWALILPRSFYVDFPLPGSDWVSTLGPYNEHLIRDYGALNLALTILLVAARTLTGRLLKAAKGIASQRREGIISIKVSQRLGTHFRYRPP